MIDKNWILRDGYIIEGVTYNCYMFCQIRSNISKVIVEFITYYLDLIMLI